MTKHTTTFGFEIEYLRGANIDTVLSNIRTAGEAKRKPALRNVSDQRTRYNTTFYADRWVQAYDCSCGWEIKSQPLTDTSEVELVMKAIRQAGGTVNESCGLHVHADVTHLTFEQRRRLAMIYMTMEAALEELLPASRRGRSQYASSNRFQNGGVSNMMLAINAAYDERTLGRALAPRGKYSKLNPMPFGSKGTWEFRAHQGTLNFKKIDAWTSLIAAMINLARTDLELDTHEQSFAGMLHWLLPHIPAALVAKRPKAGTKTGNVWLQCDNILADEELSIEHFAGTARTVRNTAELAARVAVATGINMNTCKTQVSRWAAANGHSSRVSSTTAGLRTFLTKRQAKLA